MCAAYGSAMILDVTEIQKILPHRYPFLFVDAIVEMERLKRVVGIKNVTINESHFQGHFPGKPIMPMRTKEPRSRGTRIPVSCMPRGLVMCDAFVDKLVKGHGHRT